MSYYVIDGYNLLFQIEKEETSLQNSREELLDSLLTLMKTLGFKGVIVFDSPREPTDSYPSRFLKSPLEIIFAPKELSADAYILEYLSTQKTKHTLVTSDRELSHRAKEYGALCLTVQDFLHKLKNSQNRLRTKGIEKPFQESTKNFERLLHIFEKRLQEDLEK